MLVTHHLGQTVGGDVGVDLGRGDVGVAQQGLDHAQVGPAFQQVGGALGVAIIGQIFFSDLGNSFATGGTPHAAFASASSLALWYVVGSFALVLLLSPLFKAPKAGPGRGAPAQPVLVEA